MDNAVHLAAARDINQAMTDGALQPAIVARYPLTAPAAAPAAVDRENLIGKVVIEVVA
ncbi:hypothetical protein [Leptothoe sp. PORK10 BA2]|uniref:hypothetical protein n=1 Tax=Leptothoe sp. PORK10 BA2 TaxID=3110254 RepID=UPI002B1F9ACF|nr:hypothetical protein [Leptothoe sp. PORK10 BA2]